MISGGVGITPMLSMLRYMADAGADRSVVLIWANRTQSNIFFREELDGMRSKLPRLRIHHVLSEDEGWPGEKGLVNLDLLRRLLTERDLRARVFLCGPPPMMEKVSAALRELGYPRARVHTERFSL